MKGQSGDCGCGAPAFRVVRPRASDGTAESTHDETMAYAVEASASTAMPKKKGSSGRRDGAQQGDCQRSKKESPADSRRTIHRQEPWSTYQPQYRPPCRLQTSSQSKVIGILWKVGGNRRRRGNGSCCPAASGTSGWLLFELELLDCHNTYELTLIRIRLGKT